MIHFKNMFHHIHMFDFGSN